MNIIFIKLGVGTDQYTNARIGLFMDLSLPIAAINYDDMDSNIVSALNAAIIIQITQDEFYTIGGLLVITPPVVVPTNYLITLTNYIVGCPLDGDAFFLLRAGVFFKITWDDMRTCIGSKPRQVWRVGSLGKPIIGATEYLDPIFEKDVHVLVNGQKLYPETDYVDYSPLELAEIDYYILDKPGLKITRPDGFKDELVEITQI